MGRGRDSKISSRIKFDMTETLLKLIEAYSKQDGVEFYGPQSEEHIAKLEAALEVKLPPSFKEFLRAYGGGGKKTLGISGILRNDPLWVNRGTVLGDTLLTREDFDLPKHLVVILRDYDADAIWCLDCSHSDGSCECPVVSFEEGFTQRSDGNFSSFLEEYIRLRLK